MFMSYGGKIVHTGHHLVTYCGVNGYRIRTHDFLAEEVINATVMKEDIGCFRAIIPDENK